MSFLHRMGLMYPPAGGAPLISYQDYRITITANNGASDVTGIDEIQYLDEAGVNIAQIGVVHTGVSSAHNTQSWTVVGYPIAFRTAPNSGDTDGWAGSGTSGWWQWKDDVAIEVVGATIRAHDASRMPKGFEIKYSDNGSSWTVAVAPPDQTGWSGDEARRFTWASVGAHKYWRIQILTNNGASYVGFRTVGFELANGAQVSTGRNKVSQYSWSRFDFSSRPRNLVTAPDSPPIADNNSGWLSASGNLTGNLTAKFPIPVPVKSIKLYVPNQSGFKNDRMPKDFEILGRLDSLADWVSLKTVVGQSWSDDPIEFVIG